MRSAWLRVLVVLFVFGLVVGVMAVRAPFWTLDHLVRLNLWRSGVQSRYVVIGGERIHYLETSPKPGVVGTPLVLIHGLGAKAEDWAPMLPPLAAHGYHVYALDLLGYGRSARPADASYSIAQEQALVTGFMQTLGIRNADVAGWSMGGWIAMKLAIERPEMVNRLVLYDSAGLYFPIQSPQTLFDPQTPAEFRELMAKLSLPRVPGFIVADGLRRFRRNGWIIKRSVLAMTSGADLMNFRLYQIHQPTLIVWGADDALIPLSAGESLHRGIAGSSLTTLPGCGHLAPAQCAKPALAATLTFLREQPSGTEAPESRAALAGR